jgi:hypothetical protein
MSVSEVAPAFDESDVVERDVVIASRRTVNDAIAEAATRFNLDEGNLFEFLCECGDRHCRAMTKVTLCEFWATGSGLVVSH